MLSVKLMGSIARNLKKVFSFLFTPAYTPSPWLMQEKMLTSVTLVVSHPHSTHGGQKSASQSPMTFCRRRLAVTELRTVFQTCKSAWMCVQTEASRATESCFLRSFVWILTKLWVQRLKERLGSFTFHFSSFCQLLHVHQPMRWDGPMDDALHRDERRGPTLTKQVLSSLHSVAVSVIFVSVVTFGSASYDVATAARS